MKASVILLLPLFLGCEEIVKPELPPSQNIEVVEGWITDELKNQQIRLTRSNNFLGAANPTIEDAKVEVEALGGISYLYTHSVDGFYLSDIAFRGLEGESYRVIIELKDDEVLRSDWSIMPPKTEIDRLDVDSFEENSLGENFMIFYPRIEAKDSAGYKNFYRWVFKRNDRRLTEPESITLQSDLFFDGNLIPNLFEEFEFRRNDKITVELHSINKGAFQFLEQLKKQITNQESSIRISPANVIGNLRNVKEPDRVVLGYFGAVSISSASTIAEN